jgi:hypothetical protein
VPSLRLHIRNFSHCYSFFLCPNDSPQHFTSQTSLGLPIADFKYFCKCRLWPYREMLPVKVSDFNESRALLIAFEKDSVRFDWHSHEI